MKLKIEKLIYEGYGLGRTKDKPVFVSKSVPGDELDIEIIKDNKSFSVGKINSIVSSSPKRIEPKCKHFNECGGCDHQNISYPDQLKFKDEIFKEVLRRQRVILNDSEESRDPSARPQDDIEIMKMIAGSNHPFFYRNSIRFFIKKINNKIEFCRHHYITNDLIPIQECYLQSETANNILKDLRALFNEKEEIGSLYQIKIRQGKMTDSFMVEMITNSEDLALRNEIISILKNIGGIRSIYHTVTPTGSLQNAKRYLIFGSPIILEKVDRYTFQISPESFFQTNSLGIKTLYDIIKEFAKVEMGESVLDLYCGTGSIGIFLSTFAKKVLGVDSVKSAVRDATDNARINKVSNCKFICDDVSLFLSSSVLKFDLVIVDPPRAGLKKEVVEQISKIDFKRLIYVSCNPATFARDIKLFEERGVKLQKVQPVDMFPQTYHIECVGELNK